MLLDLVLHQLGLNLEVRQLLAQALRLDAEVLALLLAHLDLLLHHDGALDGLVLVGSHGVDRNDSAAPTPIHRGARLEVVCGCSVMEILYGGVDDGVRGGESDVVAHDLVDGSR
ncbi:MAG: hypothetical protein E7L41_22000, partial [Escherichia coli]|nr:hypothetical protein [Escherichia coli]